MSSLSRNRLHQFLKYLLQGYTGVCRSSFSLQGLAGFFLFGYVGMLPNVYPRFQFMSAKL